MEEIVNYKFGDFIQLQDEQEVEMLLFYLEEIKPIEVIKTHYHNRNISVPLTFKVKDIQQMKYFEVVNIRQGLNDPSTVSILEVFELVTNMQMPLIMQLDIVQFYGALNNIKNQVMDMVEMEENNIYYKEDNIKAEEVKAGERMAKFGPLNVIDSLAGGDIEKWERIEQLPYLTVFTKLVKQAEEANIKYDMNNLPKIFDKV